MKLLPLSDYKNLTDGAEDLTTERINGIIVPKVLLLKDATVLKMFRFKRLLTTARINPYVSRFRRNVNKLIEYRIPTVEIINLYKIPAIKRTAVHYYPLAGTTLRDHCETNAMDNNLACKLGCFLGFLHEKGIYFRSIHFGNIIITNNNTFGLIDVVDMRFKRAPLNIPLRIRNLRHLFRYQSDIEHLTSVRDDFIEAYCENISLKNRKEKAFRYHFETYFRIESTSI